MTDRVAHRAAVEAGYASLAEYTMKWGDDKVNYKIHLEPYKSSSIQIIERGKEVFTIKADGTPMLGPDATVDDAAKALVDAIGNGMHKYISEIKSDNARLREALVSAKSCINDKAYTAAVMVIDTALQQKESE